MNLLRTITSVAKRTWIFLKKIYSRVIIWLQRFNPGRRARKGAVAGACTAVILFMAYSGFLMLRTGLWAIADILIGALIGVVGILIFSGGIIVMHAILMKIPRVFGGLLAGALLTFLPFIGGSDEAGLMLGAGIVSCAALIGGAVAVLSASEFKAAKTAKKVSILSLLAAMSGAAVWFFIWVASPGTTEGLTEVEELTSRTVAAIDSSDPSQPGSYDVKSLTYGSGEHRRDEFGDDVQLMTEPVNGKAFVKKLDGWLSGIRKDYWGFDRKKFPLNGTVWYPEGEGPFPLVLIVHGNHSMRDYSDPGYVYLGELLASRGYIFVTIDENFLNGDWSDNYGRENDARGWVLLEHLKVWRDWNNDESNLFHGKVDMDKISLIGHSRGGEAVCVAAAFNRLSRYPDDAKVEFDFGFNIRSIIAIAQVDGQYKPSEVSTPLENINYLALHGSHDSDVSVFSGDKQYKRIKFTDDRYYFKSSIYIYRA
ncbi:MFS transporter, partial [candidate division KSB1 bacterium]